MVFGVVIARSLLESLLANAPQIYGYTLLITEFGTEIVALALRHGFHRVIMLTDSAIELYEICLPHTCILCSFALFVYPFLLLTRIFSIIIDRILLKFPLADTPQINGVTLLVAELGTEIIALTLCCSFYCAIIIADNAIKLNEICLPHTYILCSFALFGYPFLLLIRIYSIRVK